MSLLPATLAEPVVGQLASLLLAPEDATVASPAWSAVSRAFAVGVMLADAPLVALGLVGFALGTFWAVSGGLGRAELCVVSAILLAFLSAVCDLSQLLIMRASNRTAAPLVVATQLLLAASNALRFAFLLVIATRCPTQEAWARKLAATALNVGAPKGPSPVTVIECKELTSGFDDDDDEHGKGGPDSRPAGHSGEWRSWLGEARGRVGRVFAWALLLAIMALSCVWRIGSLTSLSVVSTAYTADAVLQLALSALLALKLLATARLTSRAMRRTLASTLAELAGPVIALVLGVAIAGAGLAIAPFPEMPIGRFLRVADLYVLGVAHLVVTFRARDVHTVPRAFLVHLAAVRAASEGADDSSSGLDTTVPRHPSPTKRTSGGLCNWLRREVPHLLAPSTSSASSAASDPEATSSLTPGMIDVELGLSAGGSVDFRTPRSALGRDLGMPLTAASVGRNLYPTAARPVPALSIRTDLDDWAPRPAPASVLGSNGTFRSLNTTLGAIRVTNANADDFSSSASSASSTTNADDVRSVARLSGQRLSRPKLPRLPSFSTLRGVNCDSRTSKEDGEHLIGGGRRPSSIAEADKATSARGSGLSLPPLTTILHPPPPPAAYRPVRLHAPSSLRTASVPTQSLYSEDFSSNEDEPDPRMDARDILPSSSSTLLPRPAAVVRVSQQSVLRRSSTRASSASGQSSTGIASFYLDSFPAPPPEQLPELGIVAPTRASRIGLALGGVDLDPRLPLPTDTKERRTGSLQLPARCKHDPERGDDVDVTSFIAGSRDSPRDSMTTLTPPRLRSSIFSVASGGARPDSPATILQAQVLVRRPSLKVVHTPRSISHEPIPLAHRATDSSDESRPTPATVSAVPAIECLHRLECAIDRSKGALSDATAGIPAVIIHNALQLHKSPLRDQVQFGSSSNACGESSRIPTLSTARLVRSGSFKDRIEGRTKPPSSPAPLSAIPQRPSFKTQISSRRGI